MLLSLIVDYLLQERLFFSFALMLLFKKRTIGIDR